MFSRNICKISQALSEVQLGKSFYTTVSEGSKFSSNFKQYLKLPNGQVGSFFHDVPLNLNTDTKTLNVLIEIPRWSNAKFEINKDFQFNPITQDIKKGKPRFVKNLFPFKGYIHNYGAIPQTWDDPTITHEATGFKGDNDPIDVCEIGSKICATGDIFEAKVLGSLALIDDGELDWKVIAINKNDVLAKELNDIDDVFEKCPGLLESTRRWFKDYKIPDGKSANEFGFDGKFINAEETIKVIQHSNESWKALIKGSLSGEKIPLITNSTLSTTPGFTQKTIDEVVSIPYQEPTEIPEEIQKVYYVKEN